MWIKKKGKKKKVNIAYVSRLTVPGTHFNVWMIVYGFSPQVLFLLWFWSIRLNLDVGAAASGWLYVREETRTTNKSWGPGNEFHTDVWSHDPTEKKDKKPVIIDRNKAAFLQRSQLTLPPVRQRQSSRYHSRLRNLSEWLSSAGRERYQGTQYLLISDKLQDL